jgi:hypothetical protein
MVGRQYGLREAANVEAKRDNDQTVNMATIPAHSANIPGTRAEWKRE